jgi:hypothetical protein
MMERMEVLPEWALPIRRTFFLAMVTAVLGVVSCYYGLDFFFANQNCLSLITTYLTLAVYGTILFTLLFFITGRDG